MKRPRLFTREEAFALSERGHWIKGLCGNHTQWFRIFSGPEWWDGWAGPTLPSDDYFLVSAYCGPFCDAATPEPIYEEY